MVFEEGDRTGLELCRGQNPFPVKQPDRGADRAGGILHHRRERKPVLFPPGLGGTAQHHSFRRRLEPQAGRERESRVRRSPPRSSDGGGPYPQQAVPRPAADPPSGSSTRPSRAPFLLCRLSRRCLCFETTNIQIEVKPWPPKAPSTTGKSARASRPPDRCPKTACGVSGAEGFDAVINLLPDSSEEAAADERAIVEGQGLEYHYLPVDFANPTPTDFRLFRHVMENTREKKVLIHCAANYRVSAFYALYAMQDLGLVLGRRPCPYRFDLEPRRISGVAAVHRQGQVSIGPEPPSEWMMAVAWQIRT